MRQGRHPPEDDRGSITSHRARSTIASQLANGKQPVNAFQLMEWLGHKNLASTLSYVRTSPTRVAKAYADAGFLSRNLRTIDVIVDREAVRSGAPAAGGSWQFYDQGYGYCTYDLFDECPHRMACARCRYYVPKGSTKAQLLEGKGNLLKMRQELELTDEEVTAVEEGLDAFEKLLENLKDVPTPDGQTPRELGWNSQNATTGAQTDGSPVSAIGPPMLPARIGRKPKASPKSEG